MMNLKAVAARVTIASMLGFAALGLGVGCGERRTDFAKRPQTPWQQDGHGHGHWGGGGGDWGGDGDGGNWGGGDWGGPGWGGVPGPSGCINVGVVTGRI